jgi:hydroxymethylpyrimidine/phosphomethylpyrimidine kinase
LLPVATVLTPNLGEAALLAGVALDVAQRDLAERLLAFGPQWVLVKGGHSDGDPVDFLLGDEGAEFSYSADRADNRHTHGTGCTLASALASRLALGDSVPDAMTTAKHYITGAVQAGFPLGVGIGPTDHLWELRPALTVLGRSGLL